LADIEERLKATLTKDNRTLYDTVHEMSRSLCRIHIQSFIEEAIERGKTCTSLMLFPTQKLRSHSEANVSVRAISNVTAGFYDKDINLLTDPV